MTARKMAARDFPVLIHYAEYDGTNIRADAWKAYRWYKEMGFDVEFAIIGQTVRPPGFGHVEGTVPTKAAEFFSRCMEKNITKQ